MLKFSEYFFQIKKFSEGKYWIFKNILFVEMKISKDWLFVKASKEILSVVEGAVTMSGVHVNGLGLAQSVSVIPITKFIYTQWECKYKPG